MGSKMSVKGVGLALEGLISVRIQDECRQSIRGGQLSHIQQKSLFRSFDLLRGKIRRGRSRMGHIMSQTGRPILDVLMCHVIFQV